MIAALAVLAGLLGSLVGIGGGMVTNPMMLDLKFVATVASATSGFIIIFSAIANTIQFGISGIIVWDYALLYLVIGALCGVIGQSLIDYLVKRYNKKSVVVWAVVFAISASSILLIVTSSMRLAEKVEHKAYLGFNDICQQ